MPKAKKHWGQHFLTAPALAARLAAAALKGLDTPVWEIGPGRGILTAELIKLTSRLTAFEIDPELINLLSEKFPELSLVHQDILECNWSSLLTEPTVIASNLPYNITSPVLEKVCRHEKMIPRAVFMVQLEVAQRLVAAPGTPEYGLPTVRVGYYYKISQLFKVHPGSFTPPPKVDSAVICLERRTDRPYLAYPELFWQLTAAAFLPRRKMLRNNWKRFTKDIPPAGLPGLPDLTRRGETLAEEELVMAAAALGSLPKR